MVQCLFDVAVGGNNSYSSLEQFVISAHRRSEVIVGHCVSYCEESQEVTAVHIRSDTAVGGVVSNVTPRTHVVSGAHNRSDVGVAGTFANDSTSHVDMVEQFRSLVGVAATSS